MVYGVDVEKFVFECIEFIGIWSFEVIVKCVELVNFFFCICYVVGIDSEVELVICYLFENVICVCIDGLFVVYGFDELGI